MNSDLNLADMAAQMVASRKYRDLDLPQETLEDLLRNELDAAGAGNPPYDMRRRPIRQAMDKARARLHNIAALYLGDLDYNQAERDISAAWLPGNPQGRQQDLLRALMAQHASSRERLPVLADLYPQLWRITGLPSTLLDLACALHPLALPWMGLPKGARYRAYDLHLPRVNLLNHFFALAGAGTDAAAEHRDILVSPPTEAADVALILKEVHRFEQRRPGCSTQLLLSLQAVGVRWAVVSLPESPLASAQSPGSRRTPSLGIGYQRLLLKLLASAGLPAPQAELTLAGEMFYFILLN